MARAKLDRIDRRILSDLQQSGRMTNVDLAERALEALGYGQSVKCETRQSGCRENSNPAGKTEAGGLAFGDP